MQTSTLRAVQAALLVGIDIDSSKGNIITIHPRIRADICARLLVLILTATCTLLSSCATLPDVRYLNTSLNPSSAPTMENAQGTMSKRKSKALLAKRSQQAHLDLAAMAALEEAATGIPLIAGNKVTLLFDGPQTMTAMIAAITAAKNNINLETYIFDQDALGLKFAALLMEKQRSGVQVNIIYDGVGTLGTPAQFFTTMRSAGIHMVEFNPVNPFKRIGKWRINNRDHRKILIVDGKIAFTGGVNISSAYANSSLFHSRRPNRGGAVGWRDTHIQIEGPAVAALQWLFVDAWVSQTDASLPVAEYFPSLANEGDKLLRVLGSGPDGDHEIYKAYILALQQAKTSVHITTPYFAPDEQIILAMAQAVRRGVDVKIIFPSVSDNGMVFHAGQSFYQQLLDNGIKVYQLQIAVLHAKTAVIDGVWSTVGSTNLDMRSFLHNSEVNVIVLGDAFGKSMEDAFQEDLRDSVEVSKEAWAKRPLTNRMKEWAARAFDYWL